MFFSRFFPGKRRFFLFTKTNSLLIMEKMEKFSKGEYDMLKETFHNPLLPGFYPDPSICRVGDDYYMVTWSTGNRSVMASTDLNSSITKTAKPARDFGHPASDSTKEPFILLIRSFPKDVKQNVIIIS